MTRNRRVSFRTASLAAFVLTAMSWLACLGPDDPPAPLPPDQEGFRLVLADAEGGAALAAWRLDAPRRALVVGGSILGSGPGFVWSVDMTPESPVATTLARSPSALWWIHAVAGGTWVVGDAGYAASFDGRTLTPIETGTTATLYGVWTADGSEVWAVGGSLDPAGEQGVLLRSELGRAFEPVDYGERFDGSFYKVWGSGPDDVFVVGARGTILHFDGAGWSRMDSGTRERLGVLHGRSPTQVWAAGGDGQGLLLRWDGTSWSRETLPEGIAPLYGLWATPESRQEMDPASPAGETLPAALYVSGIYGTVARRYGTEPWQLQANAGSGDVLHSVVGWSTDQALALGGSLLDGPPFTAVVLALSSGFETGLPLDGNNHWRNGVSPGRSSGGGFQ